MSQKRGGGKVMQLFVGIPEKRLGGGLKKLSSPFGWMCTLSPPSPWQQHRFTEHNPHVSAEC